MKWIRLWSVVAATVGLSATAQADFGHLTGSSGSCKSCGCTSECQPVSCKPTIQIPCEPSVHTYQRAHSTAKPPCCNTCAAPKCCAPVSCAPQCSAPVSCAPTCSAPAETCNTCTTASTCNSCGPTKSCSLFGSKKGWSLFGSKKNCCETTCCNADPCEIAQLIYESQTACYAKQRAKAIDKLGKFDCTCNPEIMAAFVYALNDADERVRRQAADEIGDQLEDHPCCCSPEVIAALTCALGDCDKCVVRNAKKALEACGYDVVQACCEQPVCNKSCGKSKCSLFGGKSKCKTCCTTTCAPTCNTGCANGACAVAPGAAAPAPAGTIAPAPAPLPADAAPAPGAAPAPAPPADPQTYYVPARPQQKRNSLAGLLGLAN